MADIFLKLYNYIWKFKKKKKVLVFANHSTVHSGGVTKGMVCGCLLKRQVAGATHRTRQEIQCLPYEIFVSGTSVRR